MHNLIVPTQEHIGQNLTILLDSIQVASEEHEGYRYQFELGILPAHVPSDRVEMRAATYRSTLSNNIGNAIEVATMAATQPDRTFVYVGALGHGMSAQPSSKELHFLRKHGTYLVHDDYVVKPLPVVTALAHVLHNLDLQVTDLGSDSAGALLTTAYGASYGSGKILSSHQNVRPGIKDINWLRLFRDMTVTAQNRSKAHEVLSPDPLKMTSELADWGRQYATDHYKKISADTHDSMKMLINNLIGLGRGYEHDDPLVKDNVALVDANGGANVLLTVGTEDPLAQSESLQERMNFIGKYIAVNTDAEITSVLLEGMAHGPQTHYPLYLRSLAQAVLSGGQVRLY